MSVVAVTGATGFLGQALIRVLAAQGEQIVALARPTSNREPLADLTIKWIEGDVRDRASLQPLTDGADWLIHAAGMLGQAGVAEQSYRELHVTGTRNVMEAAAQCKRVLHISSPGVLGPIDGPPADEGAALAPSNAYERSKAESEKVVLDFAAKGVPVIVSRPEFIYGPGDLHVLGLFQAVQQGRFFYISGGRHMCHPTFINDAVDGMIRCLRSGEPGEFYQIAGPRPVTFRELAECIASELDVAAPRLSIPRPVAWLGAVALESAGAVVGKPAPLSRSGVAFFSEDRRFSWEKARAQLGYEPQTNLAKGVGLTVAWYKEHGYL